MKLCQYCPNSFEPNKYNQIYCSPECTKMATNERVMARYYERKENRRGKKRVCDFNGCQTKLSRYNDSNHCSIHETLRLDTGFIKEWVL